MLSLVLVAVFLSFSPVWCSSDYEVSTTSTQIRDDSKATATCNQGDWSLASQIQATFQAIGCSCPYAVKSTLDGVNITNSQYVCSMSGLSNRHITVKATCRTARECNNIPDTTEYKYMSSGWKTGTRTLKCPDNYFMLKCYYTSPWYWKPHGDFSKNTVGKGAVVKVVDNSYCTATYGKDFSLSAVCQQKSEQVECRRLISSG
eukprot:sb/3470560/